MLNSYSAEISTVKETKSQDNELNCGIAPTIQIIGLKSITNKFLVAALCSISSAVDN